MNHILVFCEKSQNYPNVPISHFQLTEIVKNGNTGYLSTESMLYFQNILQTEAQFDFDIAIADLCKEPNLIEKFIKFEKFGRIYYVNRKWTKIFIGRWRFIKMSEVDVNRVTYGTEIDILDRRLEEDQTVDPHLVDSSTQGHCGYIGDTLGYICWDCQASYARDVTLSIMKASRGYIVHCPTKFCIRSLHREYFCLNDLVKHSFPYSFGENGKFLVANFSQTPCK